MFANSGQPAISRQLLLTFFVPVVVAFLLLVLVVLSFQTARRVSVAAQEQSIAEIADFAADMVEHLWIAPREQSVRVLSNTDTFRRRVRGTADLDELLAEWRHAYDLHEGFFFIYYGLEDGSIELFPDLTLPEGFDHRIRPWYRAGMASDGDPAWSPPYTEIITGETIMSTTMPILDDAGEKIGVFAIDLTFARLVESLAAIPLPADAVVYLADENGTPFVGSDRSYLSLDDLPADSDSRLVYRTRVLDNGWQLAVVLPRDSLVQAFSRYAVPFLVFSIVAFCILFGSLALTVIRLGSRSRRLATYFSDVVGGRDELRAIFRSRDEFDDLNRRFNDVVHASRVAQADRLAQERIYRQLIERTSIGFFKVNRSGRPTYVNSSCAEVLGYDREELLAIPSVLGFCDDPADRRRLVQTLVRDGEVRDRRIKLLRKSGEPVWVAITAAMNSSSPRLADVEIDGFMVDATEHVVEHVQLQQFANTDPLTGLANRRALEAAFRENLNRHQPVSLVFFDIDAFKGMNDSHGHDVGDRVLKHIADAGTEVVRSADVFARYGGDEFAVLLPGSILDAAMGFAERLRTTIRTAPLPEYVPYMPSLSIGVVERTDPTWTLSEMVIHADRALYRSKAAGGDTVTAFGRPSTLR